jgi:uncharacterized membrane protein YoaK (UPF0700 family)
MDTWDELENQKPPRRSNPRKTKWVVSRRGHAGFIALAILAGVLSAYSKWNALWFVLAVLVIGIVAWLVGSWRRSR